ncbi:MFS transporter [Novosphingobium flavum]|uniref:Multidrug efflux pump Tap n=1 Tax=Novosphingobium flavum TaxID=1778672 RepID=A0A7X1FS79_9SPHN|nr:MFS transporter [Novosphingobium flavum]MBC2666001.1 MFS transporter [Novosphingobium flavum]
MNPVTHPLQMSDYRRFASARLLGVLGNNALVIVLGWAVYSEARETMGIEAASLRLGLIGAVQFLPFLLLSPITGVVIDRFDRRDVVRLSLIAQIACAGVLAAASLSGTMTLYLLYAMAAGTAAARAFYMPGMGALGPLIVPREHLPKAIAINSIAGRTGGILGPVIGGYAYAISPAAAYLVTTGLLGLALLCQLLIRAQARGQNRAVGNAWPLLKEGMVYVRGNRLLLGAISLDLFAVLFGGATALLPAFARDVLHVGAEGLGHMRSATAVGALATAALMSWRPVRRNVGPVMLWAVAAFGLATVGFGLSRSFALSLVCLAAVGAADMVSVYVRQSLIQLATPDEKRGRVGAISTLFVSASNELGEVESGLLGAVLGPVGAVVLGGIGSIMIAGAWTRLFPQLAAVKTYPEADAVEEKAPGPVTANKSA